MKDSMTLETLENKQLNTEDLSKDILESDPSGNIKELIQNNSVTKSFGWVGKDLEETKLDILIEISNVIYGSIKKKGILYLCGNGGSAADAQHIGVIGGQVGRGRGVQALLRLRRQYQLQGIDGRIGDFVLDGENVLQGAVVAARPQLLAAVDLD